MIYYDKIITTTNILRQPGSQTTATLPPSFPALLSPSDEEEKRMHGDLARKQRNSETEIFERRGYFHPKDQANL